MSEDACDGDSPLGEYFFRQTMQSSNGDLSVSVVLDRLNAAEVYIWQPALRTYPCCGKPSKPYEKRRCDSCKEWMHNWCFGDHVEGCAVK